MVVAEPEELISTVLQKRKLRRGESDNPAPILLSVLSQVYFTLNHNKQSEKYMSSCKVFIYGMLRVVQFFIGPRAKFRAFVDYSDSGIVVYTPRSLPSRYLSGLKS